VVNYILGIGAGQSVNWFDIEVLNQVVK
jgi:hypothetical protein